jgi:hypothetical protein
MALDAVGSDWDGIGLVVEVGMELLRDAISEVKAGLERFSRMDCGAMLVEVNEVAKSSFVEVVEMSFAFLLYPKEGIDESPDAPFGVLCLSGILILMNMK